MNQRQEHIVYLGLGSNLGDRARYLELAIEEIRIRVGRITAVSRVMETAPVDFDSEHLFLNQVIEVSSYLEADELLATTQQIERNLGRQRKSSDGVHFDRTCDIDILLYDDMIIRYENLVIPHPHMLERSFVMQPLAEIAPDLVVPGTEKTVSRWAWDD